MLSAAGGPGRKIFIWEDETRKKQYCFKLKGAKRPLLLASLLLEL